MCRSTRDLARQGDAGATTRGDEEPDLPQKSGVSGQKGATPARFPHALPGPSPSEESRDWNGADKRTNRGRPAPRSCCGPPAHLGGPGMGDGPPPAVPGTYLQPLTSLAMS